MASLSAPDPLADRSRSLRSKLCHYRPRTLRLRVVFATVAVCLFLFFITARSSSQRPVHKRPPHRPLHERPEDSTAALPEPPSVDGNYTLPSNLQKSNPSFHVLLPALQRSPALCRTVTSAMILNYPPPTLICYGRDSPNVTSKYDAMRDRITSVYNYLAHSRSVEDSDFVLIIDGLDFFFQLPPEVMIRRFRGILEENNMKLRKKYGLVEVKQPSDKRIGEVEQKYTQRVLFGASKHCFPNMTNDAGCASVPQSSLPPDAYGYKTDIHRNGHLNRPRWLNPSTVMGQAADLKPIYARMLQFIENRNSSRGDYLALTQMYGQQEYVRELERRRTSNGFKEWLYKRIGISDASNITGVNVRLESGQRYEYGIGVDYASQLFFNMNNSKRDVEWLQYHNISRTSSVQGEHGVPRERRLLLPSDLAHIANPFVQPDYDSENTVTPPHNKTIDYLPNPRNHSWNNLPLLTNVHSAAVPALVHMDEDQRWLRDKWWSKMWYHKWARALLRKHTRTPSGFTAAQSALLGGQEWWDLRGGRGGVWTDRAEWINYPELCNGFERDIFDDNYGPWGKEVGASSERVYNQFGRLIKGKEEPEERPEPPREPEP